MKRTNKQNNALHQLFTNLADQLNENGLDMKKTLKPEIDIPWSQDTVKEFIWRPVMQAQLGKTSTTDLTTKEIDKVFLTLSRHFGDRFGLVLTFPSIESLIAEQEGWKTK